VTKIVTPKWILDEDVAVGIDQYNWILYRRSYNKAGEPTVWVPKSYFPKLRGLLQGLQDDLMLTDTGKQTIKDHVECATTALQAQASALATIMATIGAGLDTLPPAYAKYREQ